MDGPASAPPDSRAARAAWYAAYALLALLTGLRFRGFAFDDPFITYRVARNIAEGQGWVYNLGERINAVTNPLYTLLLAGLHLITSVDFPTLGAAVTMAGLFLAAVFLARLIDGSGLAPAGRLAGLLVIIHPLLVGCMGMETGLLLALSLGAVLACARERWTLGSALFGLAVLTRPDAVVLAGVALIYYSWSRKKAPGLTAAIAFALVIAPWLIFSWFRFHELLPHTLTVKSAQGAVPAIWQSRWVYLQTLGSIMERALFPPDLTGIIALILAVAGVTAAICGKDPWLRVVLAWAVLHAAAYGVVLRVPAYTWYFAPVVLAYCLVLAQGAAEVMGAATKLKRPYAPFALLFGAGLLIWAVCEMSGTAETLRRWFNPVHGAHALGYLALAIAASVLAAARLRGRRWARTAAALALCIAAFLPRNWVGLLQLTQAPTAQYFYYKAAADWISANEPAAKTVGAHEIGVLGYFLPDRTIIDQCGIPTPGAAEHMAAGDMTWWVRAYRPELIVLHPYRKWWQGSEGPLLDAPWFKKAYQRIALIPSRDASGRPVVISGAEATDRGQDQRLAGKLEKHSSEIWRLQYPGAVPGP
ncbi:MAG TPA: hypothetical protein VM658_17775 [bacterium]|nr:hypothetical protein [bacterium]